MYVIMEEDVKRIDCIIADCCRAILLVQILRILDHSVFTERDQRKPVKDITCT